MEDTQREQEAEYRFPYHYLPQRTELGMQLGTTWSWGYRYIASLDYLLGRLRQLEFQSLVDVGCGDGRFVAEIASSFPNAHVEGVDYSHRAIGMAKAMNPPGRYRCVDVIDEQLEESHDLLTSIEVLEHIQPPMVARFVAGMRRLTHDKGRLLLTVPHVNQPLIPKHYQHFSLESLRQSLAPHFTIDDVRYIDKRSRLLAYSERALVNRHFTVTNERLLGAFSKFYAEQMLLADERDGQRMVALCSAV